MYNNLYLKQLVIWAGVFALFHLYNSTKCTPAMMYVYTGLFIQSHVIAYYFLHILVFPLAEKGKYLKVFLGFIISYIIFLSIYILNYKFLFPILDIDTPRNHYPIPKLLVKSLRSYSELLICAYAVMLSRIGIAKTKKYNALMELRISSELALLKNQFHSHLNLNFLNFCYGKLLRTSRTASDAVENYIGMLDYTLKANHSNKILLENEIQYIDSFVNLQKCINTNSNCIIKKEGKFSDYMISPMLLGVLVEFAFKYSIYTESDHPIQVKIEIKDSSLFFNLDFVIDSKNETTLENDNTIHHLRQYLSAQYIDQFRLDYLCESNLKYNLFLNIKLSEENKI
jgi:two-component system, LytTR family, sensor kinase